MTVTELLNHFIVYIDTIYYKIVKNTGIECGKIYFNVPGEGNEEKYNKFIDEYGDFYVLDWEASHVHIDVTITENI